MAELLSADRGGERQDRERPLALHDADRSAVRAMRRASRPRVRRRPAPDRPALLHEFSVAEVHQGRRTRQDLIQAFSRMMAPSPVAPEAATTSPARRAVRNQPALSSPLPARERIKVRVLIQPLPRATKTSGSAPSRLVILSAAKN